MKKAIFVMTFFLSACASNSGVVPIGPDTYMVSRQAATGFSGLGSLKVEAIKEAGKYCSKQQKSVQVVSANDSKPPYIFGNFPRTEIEFKCLQASPVTEE